MTNNIENSFASFLHTIDEDYTTEKILKSGPRGSVVLLRRKTDNVRFLFRRYAGDGSVYRALLTVKNPHLPQIYRVEEADGETAVLEQYIYGDTLAYILEGGPLTDEEASRLVCQICDALHTLHELGAVHRDIKPENVLVSGDTAVLIDFDASRIVKPETESDTQILGTTGYAAPEQYGFSQTDARSDIYSLGVLLNVALTGRHPATQLCGGRLRPIVETCISVNTDLRFHSVDELAAALTRPARRAFFWPALCVLLLLVFTALFFMFYKAPAPEVGSSSVSSFSYDMDGDGEEEDYLFGVLTTFNPAGGEIRPWGRDIFSLPLYDTATRTAAPGVWRSTPAGPILAPELLAVLQDASIELVCGTQTGTEKPIVADEAPLFGQFSPAIIVYYSTNSTGVWLYRAHATLNGQALEAFAVSEQLPMEEFTAQYGN